MARRTNADLENDAIAALTEALAHLGVMANVLTKESVEGSASGDAVFEIAGQRFDIEVKSVVTAEHGRRLVERVGRGMPLIVVADRIATDAKRALRDAGVNYLDRRGELRIVAPPLILHTSLEFTLLTPGTPGGSLDSQVAKEVAIACLLAPDQPHGVRQIARYINRAPSAVSTAMAGLRDDGLLTSAGEAMVPDLFHALLAVWRRRLIPLHALPRTSTWEAQRLGLGLDAPESTTGWALTDTRAAMSWGMPIIARGDYPPDFYVPDKATLRTVSVLYRRAADPEFRACTVALAPVRLACLRRVDHSQTTGEQWPLANHIVVALDIAQDQARGLDALEQWKPDGIARAW